MQTVLLLELTCPFNSHADLSAARECKQKKSEYLQIVAELDCLGFVSLYHTIEIGCLGHHLMEIVKSMKQVSNHSFSRSKASLDRAATVAITENPPCSEQSYLDCLTFVCYFCIFPCYAYPDFDLCNHMCLRYCCNY